MDEEHSIEPLEIEPLEMDQADVEDQYQMREAETGEEDTSTRSDDDKLTVLPLSEINSKIRQKAP